MRLLIIICLVTTAIIANGQATSTVRKVVTLLPEQGIYLNSTSNGAFGGKSRVNYKIDLPPNTVEWYYIYSTTPTEGKDQSLGLVAQLTRVVDPTGISAVAVNALRTPSGSGGLIDVYVMGYENRTAFIAKDYWGAWEYDNPGGYEEGRTLNAKQGKKKIDDVLSGTVYIGLKNPHVKDGVNVTIEVAAIIEVQDVDMTVWTAETKEMMYDTYLDDLISGGMSEQVAQSVANCVLEKLVSQYTLSDFANKSESEMNVIGDALEDECMTELKGGVKTEEEEKGATVGRMAWKAYESGDLDKAISYSNKALEYDKTLGWVHGNLGLFYLIKNDALTALDYYLEAITQIKKDKINAKHYFSELIKDIENAKQKYPDLSGYEEIVEQLQRERDNI